jgi:hypothetical protein
VLLLFKMLIASISISISIAIIIQEDHFTRDKAEREADIRLQRKAEERQELKHQREEGSTFILGSFKRMNFALTQIRSGLFPRAYALIRRCITLYVSQMRRPRA